MIRVEQIDNPIQDAWIVGDYKPNINEQMRLFMFRMKQNDTYTNVYAKEFISIATAGKEILLSLKNNNITYNIKGIIYDKDRDIKVLWK